MWVYKEFRNLSAILKTKSWITRVKKYLEQIKRRFLCKTSHYEGQMFKTLDYTIRVGSTPNFLQARTGLCTIVPLAQAPFGESKWAPD